MQNFSEQKIILVLYKWQTIFVHSSKRVKIQIIWNDFNVSASINNKDKLKLLKFETDRYLRYLLSFKCFIPYIGKNNNSIIMQFTDLFVWVLSTSTNYNYTKCVDITLNLCTVTMFVIVSIYKMFDIELVVMFISTQNLTSLGPAVHFLLPWNQKININFTWPTCYIHSIIIFLKKSYIFFEAQLPYKILRPLMMWKCCFHLKCKGETISIGMMCILGFVKMYHLFQKLLGVVDMQCKSIHFSDIFMCIISTKIL